MAKIIAAYIAQGNRTDDAESGLATDADRRDLALEWQRLYCLFALLARFYPADQRPQFILYTDHAAPPVDGLLIDKLLRRLGVDVEQIFHNWRPDGSLQHGRYFIFDAIERLAIRCGADDTLVVFSSRALAVYPVDVIFNAITAHRAVLFEEATGDMQDGHMRARRERMVELRNAYQAPLPTDALLSVSPDVIGLSAPLLRRIEMQLRKLFPKNWINAHRGVPHFRSPSEILAALLAMEGIYRPTLPDMTRYAAAMPDQFIAAHRADMPVIVPGYGKEPVIPKLFSALLPDQDVATTDLDLDAIFQSVQSGDAPVKHTGFSTLAAKWRDISVSIPLRFGIARKDRPSGRPVTPALSGSAAPSSR